MQIDIDKPNPKEGVLRSIKRKLIYIYYKSIPTNKNLCSEKTTPTDHKPSQTITDHPQRWQSERQPNPLPQNTMTLKCDLNFEFA